MQNNGDNCETCGPNGLKFSNINGVTRVEVPQDFGFEDQGGIGPMVERAMALGQQWEEGHSLHAAARPDTGPSSKSAPPGEYEMTPHQISGSPLLELIRPLGSPSERRIDQFTLAETDAAEVMGLWASKTAPTTNQFTSSDTGAAAVLGLFQENESPKKADGTEGEKAPDVVGADGKTPFPNYDEKPRKAIPLRGGTKRSDINGKYESERARILPEGTTPLSGNAIRAARLPAGFKEIGDIPEGVAKRPKIESCDTSVYFERTFAVAARPCKECERQRSGVKWSGEGKYRESNLDEGERATLKRLGTDSQRKCNSELLQYDEQKQTDLLTELVESQSKKGLHHTVDVNQWEEIIAYVANSSDCPPNCRRRKVEAVLWEGSITSAKWSGVSTKWGSEAAPEPEDDEIDIVVNVCVDLWIEWKVLFSITCVA